MDATAALCQLESRRVQGQVIENDTEETANTESASWSLKSVTVNSVSILLTTEF
jgi:hypothetical protein